MYTIVRLHFWSAGAYQDSSDCLNVSAIHLGEMQKKQLAAFSLCWIPTTTIV